MKEKLRKILANKWFRFFIPVLIYLLIFGGEYLFDVTVGDGDGKITLPVFIKARPWIKLILALYLIYNIFTILFRMSLKQTLFNFGFVLLVLYSLEYILYKKDPFLKGPFDSGYYYGGLVKYANFYEPPKGYTKNYITWGHSTKKNKYYFRDDEIVFPKPDSVFRIMVLGDSFTWGAGLSESEMYANQLDSMLKLACSPKKIEVVNCALAGSPTVRERDILRQLKDTVKPDLILIGFCVNDPQPKSEDYSIEKDTFEKKWGNVLSKIQTVASFIRLNYIGELIVSFVYRYQYKSGKFPDPNTSLGRVYDKNSKEWKNFESALHDIKNMSDSLDCPPPVAGIFTQIGYFECETDITEEEKKAIPLHKRWLDQVDSTFIKLGFNTVYFVPIFEQEARNGKIKGNELMVHPLDGHPSAKMNKVFTRELFARIVPIINSKVNSVK